MTEFTTTGQFVLGPGGQMFVLSVEPRRSLGCVLVVPPFAEEMNKSRRMMVETARMLAANGIKVVIPDLSGTGDSAGDFADARWAIWQQDLQHVSAWCADHGTPVTNLLAIRSGAALAQSTMKAGYLRPVERTVFWQPVFDGNRFLTQFLRLRVAAAATAQGRRETAAELRQRLLDGETLEVAGYSVSGALATALDALVTPAIPAAGFGKICWMELVRATNGGLNQPTLELLERWRSAGAPVEVSPLAAEPFWNSSEILVHPSLIAATVAAFKSR